MNDLNNFTGMIGSIVISAVILSIPILCTCSFVFNWDIFFKFVLTMLVIVETTVLSVIIYVER